MFKEEIKELVMDLADEIEDMGFGSEDLDDLVYEEAMDQASQTNNSGPWDQLLFLMENGWDRDTILGRLVEE